MYEAAASHRGAAFFGLSSASLVSTPASSFVRFNLPYSSTSRSYGANAAGRWARYASNSFNAASGSFAARSEPDRFQCRRAAAAGSFAAFGSAYRSRAVR